LVNNLYLWAFIKTHDFKSKVINYTIFASIIKLAEVDFQFTFSIALNIKGVVTVPEELIYDRLFYN
jgi:hypothetical protein